MTQYAIPVAWAARVLVFTNRVVAAVNGSVTVLRRCPGQATMEMVVTMAVESIRPTTVV